MQKFLVLSIPLDFFKRMALMSKFEVDLSQ
jgi:hypothetical protein